MDEKKRYIPHATQAFPIGEGQVLEIIDDTKKSIIVPIHLSHILHYLHGFKSMDQHTQALASLGFPDKGSATTAIEELKNLGLLYSKKQFLETIEAQSTQDDSNPIQTLAVLTCNRPLALERCLQSFYDYNKNYDNSIEIIVYDDSSVPDISTSNRKIIQKINEEQGNKIHYHGPEQKKALLQKMVNLPLVKEIDPNILSFALQRHQYCPYTYGANLNNVLLTNINKNIMTVDDDMVFQTTRISDKDGLAFYSARDISEYEIHKNRDELLKKIQMTQTNIFEEHETLLGKSLSACIQTFVEKKQPLFLETITPRFARQIDNPQAKIKVTQAGVFGDNGMSTLAHILLLDDDNRSKAYRTREAYTTALHSREVVRGVTQHSISNGSFLMSGNMALNNSRFLPPFIPVTRNCDGLFAAVLRKCFPQSYIGYVPYCLLHSPLETRNFSPDMLQTINIRFQDLLDLVLQTFSPPQFQTRENTLQNLGQYLASFKNMADTSFIEMIRFIRRQQMSQFLHQLETRLEQAIFMPDFWAKDMDTYIKAIQKHIQSPNLHVPRDIDPSLDDDAVMKICKEAVEQYGELVRIWPTLYEALSQHKCY